MSATVGGAPLWYEDAAICQRHVQSLFDANGDGIGDFQGLIAKLDYIASLGFAQAFVRNQVNGRERNALAALAAVRRRARRRAAAPAGRAQRGTRARRRPAELHGVLAAAVAALPPVRAGAADPRPALAPAWADARAAFQGACRDAAANEPWLPRRHADRARLIDLFAMADWPRRLRRALACDDTAGSLRAAAPLARLGGADQPA